MDGWTHTHTQTDRLRDKETDDMILTLGGEHPRSCWLIVGINFPKADPSTIETLWRANPRKVFTIPARVTARE